MASSMLLGLSAMLMAARSGVAVNEGLKQIEHIVFFMQENRAFDEYFGTMAGVRGFMDPNVQVNPDGLSTFEQPAETTVNQTVSKLKPWHVNYLGGDYLESTQCIGSGGNDWTTMHNAWNGGLNNGWAKDTPYTWAYFERSDVPVHWDIAEGWTVLDMATEGVLAATDPNRVLWMSGSVNIPGSPSNPDGDGGLILDNNATPGCETDKVNCYPFTWKTFPEYLEEAGISWQVYQEFDNFEDNMLAYFVQYQNAQNGSALREKGNSYPGLKKFYDDAKAGTLPQVSWIVGPQELSEHAPNTPRDGAWLQKQVVDAVTQGAGYDKTALYIMYDEGGGFGDHVAPFLSPQGTAGEWMDSDPFTNDTEPIPVGPGFRVPAYMISPWTRGGKVFTEHVDHISCILFTEAWAEANGYKGVYSKEVTQWRRDHISDLVNIFDFSSPDSSLPSITEAETPGMLDYNASDYSGNFTLGSLSGDYVGPSKCLADYAEPKPPVPFGDDNLNQNLSLTVEEGFKQVRGRLTEGRYLTFEALGFALANPDGTNLGVTPCSSTHDDVRQRWVIHAQDYDSNAFTLSSAYDGQYISTSLGQLTNDSNSAQKISIDYHADGSYYTAALGADNGTTLSIDQDSKQVKIGASSDSGSTFGFQIYSVSYHG